MPKLCQLTLTEAGVERDIPNRDIPIELTDAWSAATEDPQALDALGASRGLFASLSRWQGRLVAEALEAGATWEQIGATLGTTRQAAWARFREVAEQTEGRRVPMPEQVVALQSKLADEIKALQAKLKSFDAEGREDRKRVQEELRRLERERAEQRASLQQELKDTAAALRAEIRSLREPPK
jgi:Spy/CpxP family protein refolding chaperone